MARKVCVYCDEDVGEALPREDWAQYPPNVATSCVCDKPECLARLTAMEAT